MIVSRQEKFVRLGLCFAVLANICFWISVRDVQSQWLNVPAPPPAEYAAAAGLGDRSLAYRMNSITIQNFGDTGGRMTALKDYNFEKLADWFFIQDRLDPKSNHIPYLAAYYFSSSQEPQKIRPILLYLERAGSRIDGEKWRWLAQAVFLARFKLNDLDLALSMARKLAALDKPDMPAWTKQMPAFVMNAKGEKEAAYALMLEILKSGSEKMHPEEVQEMQRYMCTVILDEAQAKDNPICEQVKKL